MDLHFVEAVMRPQTRAALPLPVSGDAFLGGGTWLFSEPQAELRRLVDLVSLAWPALATLPDGGLEIAATCRFAELAAHAAAAAWPASAVFGQCVEALWGSFKIHHTATVGGNLCLALPAAPMAALMTALDAECVVWTADGGERRIPASGFVTGAGRNALHEGELLRAMLLPGSALRRRCLFRQASLTRFGRSATLLIATVEPGTGAFALTVTAAVRAPVRLQFAQPPTAAGLSDALSSVLTARTLHDDVHGTAGWKCHMTRRLAEELRQELAA